MQMLKKLNENGVKFYIFFPFLLIVAPPPVFFYFFWGVGGGVVPIGLEFETSHISTLTLYHLSRASRAKEGVKFWEH